MYEAEIHHMIYLSQQMILGHQVFQKHDFILCLLRGWLLSQHFIHLPLTSVNSQSKFHSGKSTEITMRNGGIKYEKSPQKREKGRKRVKKGAP